MHTFYPCLWFDGNAEEAAELYTSLLPECDDQAEVDRLWEALTADGGEPGPCGWLKDRFGLSWQIVPRELNVLVDDPDTERARRAMDASSRWGRSISRRCGARLTERSAVTSRVERPS